MYSSENILDYVKEEDVKFIRLAFCNPYGVQKNISIMPPALDVAFNNGIPINGLNIFNENKTLYLKPIADTISVLPWRPSHGRVVRMFCEILDENNKSYSLDSRRVLIDACNYLALKNVELEFQIKYDFYLFKLDLDGNNTNIPYDNAGFMDIAPEDKGENVRRDICLSLTEMDINPMGSFHEAGPGQNRIFCEKKAPLKAADDSVTFKSVVKTISARNGLYSDFSYRPVKDNVPNRIYLNITAKNGDIKKLYSNLVKCYSEIELFVCPNKEIYDVKNRIHLDNDTIVIEATGDMNPYLAYALVIYGMFEDASGSLVNTSITEAKENASKSNIVKKFIGSDLLSFYTK